VAAQKDAVESALGLLRARDLSASELDRRLAARGYGSSERDDARERLIRTGILDDARFARARARALASRGSGDALIRYELQRAGVELAVVDDVLGELDPEDERAQAVVARRGAGPKTARYLVSKGFSDDVVAAVAGERRRGIG
jgi:regulatory protein